MPIPAADGVKVLYQFLILRLLSHFQSDAYGSARGATPGPIYRWGTTPAEQDV